MILSIRQIRWVLVLSILMVLLGGMVYSYLSPWTYVSLDINPSIEYVVNRYGRVVEVQGMNEDGKKRLADGLEGQVLHHSIQAAVANTLSALEADGLFADAAPDALVLATSSQDMDKATTLSKVIAAQTVDQFQQLTLSVPISALVMDPAVRLEAYNQGLSMGRYHAIEAVRLALKDQGNMPNQGQLATASISELQEMVQGASTNQPATVISTSILPVRIDATTSASVRGDEGDEEDEEDEEDEDHEDED